MLKKIAIVGTNVQEFIYQSTGCVEIEIDVPDEFLTMPTRTESGQNRFYVKDGIVCKYTEAELKNQPRFTEYLAECRKARYEKETDYLKEKVIEILAKESNDPIVMEWIKGKAKIREEVK